MAKLSLQNLINGKEITGKNILVRVDYNVPIDSNGVITDDKRILESLVTIKAIILNGGKCILMSHLGRPKGEKNLKYSLSVVAEYLSNVLNKPVLFSDDCIGDDNKEAINNMKGEYTILIIAHRFSTIQNVDKVIVIENGKISNYGTPKELSKQKGLYSELLNYQIEGNQKLLESFDLHA